ncbi:hypothetical protein Dimus_025793 [Dionaea muscipula]
MRVILLAESILCIMADRTMSLGTPEMGVAILKETLHAQQELLQQLYNELDVEREAAATATSEALSMMLRLQGEKAAVEMEASQYKRIAEEKLFHAEEALAIFRELIYQKEMQIASLEFQVQAYRFNLLSMGYSDLGVSGTQYPENMLMRNGLMGDKGARRLRRGNSLPPLFPKNGDSLVGGEKSSESSPKTLEEIKEQDTTADRKLENSSTLGDYNTYWEQIRKLDERVKELSTYNDFCENSKAASTNGFSRSHSSNSQTSISSLHDPTRQESPSKPDERVKGENLSESATISDCPSPIEVQDIFEVPQASAHYRGRVFERKEKKKLNMEVDRRLGKLDLQEVVNSYNSDRSCRDKRLSLTPDSDNKSSKPSEALTIERQLYYQRPAVADLEFQQLNRRLKSLEDERITTRQEITAETGEEGLKLLKEIKQQLNVIQDEVMSWKTKNSTSSQNPELASLSEVRFLRAMLHFWL